MALKVVPIASKSDDCNVWTGEQAVEGFLADIASGKIKPVKLMILWFEETPEGALRPHRWFARMNRCEEVALLEVAKAMAMEEWRG